MENKHKRYEYLKKELEKAMPSVTISLIAGFTPANYKMLENMAQEFFTLKEVLYP